MNKLCRVVPTSDLIHKVLWRQIPNTAFLDDVGIRGPKERYNDEEVSPVRGETCRDLLRHPWEYIEVWAMQAKTRATVCFYTNRRRGALSSDNSLGANKSCCVGQWSGFTKMDFEVEG
jgi:hypothetical protein